MTSPDRRDSDTPDAGLDGGDRIFPIRSVISVDPSTTGQSSPSQIHPLSPSREGARQYSIIDADTWNQLQSQPKSNTEFGQEADNAGASSTSTSSLPAASTVSRVARHPTMEDISSTLAGDDDSARSSITLEIPDRPPCTTFPKDDSHDQHPVTARFQHIMTDGGHAVITGRDGSFRYCEDEPIHIPGAVQSFGALVALREESDNQLVVRVASENTKAILGYSPKELFELDSFCDIMSEEQADNLLDHVDFVRDDACDPSVDGPEVFMMSLKQPNGRPLRLWCAIHINHANKGLILCEFELEDDRINPLNISGQTTPVSPSDTLGMDPSPEEFAASTINISQPLRVLRNARRRRGEAAVMEVFNILSQIQEQLSRAQTLDVLLNTTAGLVKELTGFHRVMIYQFDSSWNGTVIAELVDPRTTKDLYKGLRFPASDIPKQARELYKINKVRLLYDRDQVTARLVCRTTEDLETPLDMTHSYLRAMSPIHIKYLANMAVRASMSISINAFSELWGLISCHTYGTSGTRVSFPIRKMCRLIGDTVSRNIERLSYASRLQARKLINTLPTEANPSGYIIASSDDLLKLFDADYGALSIRDETKILGKVSHSQEVLALLEYMKMRQISSVLTSRDVTKDFPDLRYPGGFKEISGLLYVPLSSGGSDFIAFFRRGQLTEIKWAGNPYEKEYKKGTPAYLEPRTSFQTWKETVLNQSREWSESDVDTAAVLCLVYGKFIQVWRQKEAARQSSQVTRLLLANSAHEVRTPLNAIINYLEIALEGALDSETRDNLTKSHSASKSLIYVINDLLDLTNAEKGQNLIKDEFFDLPTTIKEATGMFEAEAKRKQIGYNVTVHPGLPPSVSGDQRRVRQVIMNLISNAIQHTNAGNVSVEVWRSVVQPRPGHACVEMTVVDTGSGMSQSTLERLFQDLEQVLTGDDKYYYEQEENQASPTIAEGEEPTQRVLGLGLALVARIVRNSHGQLSVKSDEGKGSRFKILLQFPVPDDVASVTEEPQPAGTGAPATPRPTEGEFMLVDSSAHDVGRIHTNESGRSAGSFKSPPLPGQEPVTDSGIPSSSALRIPQEDLQRPPSPPIDPTRTGQSSTTAAPQPSTSAASPDTISHTLSVLVAEDDPINSKIVQKRLSKFEHSVHLTVNGDDCVTAYRANPTGFDAVLMDIQMPIVDGMGATKMIRDFEAASSTENTLSEKARLSGRIPVFAVSASLVEKDIRKYMNIGFDGWIMKPIDFNRLNVILQGVQQDSARISVTYEPGMWEKGGWFQREKS